MPQTLYKLLSSHLSEHKLRMFDAVALQRTRYITLVLEDIYQAQNTSAIIRSAESWGIQDIHVIENHHTFHQHQRISKGAADWLTFYRYNSEATNSHACFEHLKKKGYRIAVTSMDPCSISPSEIALNQPLAIVMGTELSGVSETAKTFADVTLKIPTWGFTKSLNVAAAAAAICHSITERIRDEKIQWSLSEEDQLLLKTEWAKKSISWSKYLIDMYETNEIK